MRRLTLSRETLRNLTESSLRRVVGGESNQDGCTTTDWCTETCNNTNCNCPTGVFTVCGHVDSAARTGCI